MLRLAQSADAPTVHAILWAAKAEIPLADNFADAEHQRWVHEQCSSGAVWVLEQDSAPAGVMLIRLPTKVLPAEISYLAVNADKRRAGIGRALIKHAQVTWTGGLRARVKPQNMKMIDLLQSEGFEYEAGEYVDGDDWIWFTWLPP